MHAASLVEAMARIAHVENIEGLVALYSNGLRVKFKTDEYIRLHKILTGLSNIGIWETLRAGKSIVDILEHVPDEFYGWATGVEQDLKKQYAADLARALRASTAVLNLPDRKAQAMELQSKFPDVQHLAFGLLDNKNIADNIWKRLRPTFARPFRTDIDA